MAKKKKTIAKHRGTGSQKSTQQLTIGNGGIRDFFRWLTGDDVSIKYGNKNIGETGKQNLKEQVMGTLEFGKRMPNFGKSYNILRDFKGKYPPPEGEVIPEGLRPREEYVGPRGGTGYAPLSRSQKSLPATQFYRRPINDQVGSREFTPYKGPEAYRTRSYSRRVMPPTYGSTGSPVRVPAPPMIRPLSNVPPGEGPPRPPLIGEGIKRPLHPQEREMYNRNINPQTSPPIPAQDEFFGDEWGSGSALGGPVKKRKRKKYMGGGKMKKYAKGGGIRKPKYS